MKKSLNIWGKLPPPPFWCLLQKLDHNSGLHAKSQREISSNKIKRQVFGLLEGENVGKGGEWYKDMGKWIKMSRIEFPDPMLMTLDTPQGPITKFLKRCQKNERKNYFSPTLVLDSKTRSKFRPACKISERNL